MPLLHLLLAAWLGGQGPAADSSAMAGTDAGALLRLDAGPAGPPSGMLARPDSSGRPRTMAALLGEQDETEDGHDVLPGDSSAASRFVRPDDDRAPRWPLAPCRDRYPDRSAALRC